MRVSRGPALAANNRSLALSQFAITPKLRFRYPSLPVYAVCAAAVPVLFYAACSSSTLPVDLLNALHFHEFTSQEFFVGGLNSYAVALINIGWFRTRLYRKHAGDIARLDLMVEVERLSGDRYPMAAHHARIEQSLLRKELGNLVDPRTEKVISFIGRLLKKLL